MDLKTPFTLLPKKVSALFNFKEDVGEDIVSLASTGKTIETMPNRIKERVIPFLNPVHIEDMKENLRRLIKSDGGIAPVTREGLLAISAKGNEYLADFLSMVYLYAIGKSNKEKSNKNTEAERKSADSLFAQKINAVSDKTKNHKNTFHYLNANFGYYGRTAEKERFISFLESECQILTMAVTGYGGSGKSKFVYETITRLQQAKSQWKFVYLDKLFINDIAAHTYCDYSYGQPLCMIVDYAGRHSEEIGTILQHLSNIESLKLPDKIRLVLIERQGMIAQGDYFNRKLIYPDWYQRILRASNNCEILSRNVFLEMSDLAENDIKSLALDYRNSEGVGILDKHGNDMGVFDSEWNRIWEYVNRRGVLSAKVKTIRPLIVLFMIDSSISSSCGAQLYEWSIDDILEKIIHRYEQHWKENLCGNDLKLFDAIKKVLMFSTACEAWSVGNRVKGLENETNLLNGLGKTRLSEILPYINEYDVYENKMLAFEPDLLGEFFVLRMLNDMASEEERNNHIKMFWNINANSFAAFLQMCIDDYSYSKYFYGLFDDFQNTFLSKGIYTSSDETDDLIDGLLVEITYVGESAGSNKAKRAAEAIKTLKKRFDEGKNDDYMALRYTNGLFNRMLDIPLSEARDIMLEIKRVAEMHEEDGTVVNIYGESMRNMTVILSNSLDANETPKTNDAIYAEIYELLDSYYKFFIKYSQTEDDLSQTILYNLVETISGAFRFEGMKKDFCLNYIDKVFHHTNDFQVDIVREAFTNCIANFLTRNDATIEDIILIYETIINDWIPEYETKTGKSFIAHSGLLANLTSKFWDIDGCISKLKILCEKDADLEITENYAVALFNRLCAEVAEDNASPKILDEIANEYRRILAKGYSDKKAYWLCRSLYHIFECYVDRASSKAVIIAKELKDHLISCVDKTGDEIADLHNGSLPQFVSLLSAQCESDNIKTKRQYIKILRELYQAYGNNQGVAECHAYGVLWEVKDANDDEGERINRLVNELRELHCKFSKSKNIADYYADAVSEITVILEKEDIEDCLVVLKSLYDKFPKIQDIAYSYLFAIRNFTSEHEEPDIVEHYFHVALSVHRLMPDADEMTATCLEIANDFLCSGGDIDTAQGMIYSLRRAGCLVDSDYEDITEARTELEANITKAKESIGED